MSRLVASFRLNFSLLAALLLLLFSQAVQVESNAHQAHSEAVKIEHSGKDIQDHIGQAQHLQSEDSFVLIHQCLSQIKQYFEIPQTYFNELEHHCHCAVLLQNNQPIQQEEASGHQSVHQQIGEIQQINKIQQLASHNSTLHSLFNQLRKLGPRVTRKHIAQIADIFKKEGQFKGLSQCIYCLINHNIVKNPFLTKEPPKRKLKIIYNFIKQLETNNSTLLNIFDQTTLSLDQQVSRFCLFLNRLFNYYYLEVNSPTDNLSTLFFRELTVRTNLFSREDVSQCLSLDTAGPLAHLLEGLDINNIFERVPQIFLTIKHAKFKCKEDRYELMAKEIKTRLADVDMFDLMYEDYDPYVDIAAEKNGVSQVKKLAVQFAKLLNSKASANSHAKQSATAQM